MKTKMLICLLCCIMISVKTIGQIPKVHKDKIELFPLNSVRITDGEFKIIQDLQHKYLLSLQPNRLLSLYRTQARLKPKDKPYPCWESEDVWGGGPLTGHILGFYLSSMSMMYQSTYDKAILDSLDRVLDELMECQIAGKDGYLLATISGRHIFDAIVSGNFETDNALIKRTAEPVIKSWEPVYVMNKVMLGLYSV